MSPRTDPTDPANMTPEERLAEIGMIIGQGVLRLRERQAVSTPNATHIHPVESVESAGSGLDECAETSPHGQRG